MPYQKKEEEKKQRFGRKEDQKKKGAKEKEVQKLKQENQDLREQYQRALADYHNLLKRSGKEKEELVKYANESLLKDLLPVFDHLKLSLAHVSGEDEESQWVQGVRYVVKQFREVLEENGVKEIKAEGEKFDPEYMEALEGEGEVVKKEVKPGYTLNDKVIIPVKVVVASDTDDKESKEQEQKDHK